MDQSHAPPMHNDMPDGGAYGFYGGGDGEHNPPFGVYQDSMNGYGGMVNPNMPPRNMSADVMQPQFSSFDRAGVPMGLMPPHQIQTSYLYQNPQHMGMGMVGSPPASPSIYEALSPPISGSDTSGNEAHYHSRNHSGATSPTSSRRNSLIARGSLRYNPTPSPSSGSERRRQRGASMSEDDDDGIGGHGDHQIASQRKEATRKQRIEAEQKRRDELRDGYAKLKDVLPVSNAKSSKVSLLDRATKHIVDLERRNDDMNARLTNLEQEVRRLRALNEKISLSVGMTPAAASSPGTSVMSGTRTPSGASPMLGAQPLSPPPDPESHSHLLTAVARHDAPDEHSDGSDGF